MSTLLGLDSSPPGGWIVGDGDLPYGRTMAFTMLMLCQMVNVLNARSDRRSAVDGLFANRWLWASIALSVALQAAVMHVPAAAGAVRDGGAHRRRLAPVRRGGKRGAVDYGDGEMDSAK